MSAPFIVIGEKIHCTRIFKVGGESVKVADGASPAVILYKSQGEARTLPVPAGFTGGAAWKAGKVKHCAVAIWQGVYGSGADRAAGVDYLQAMARQQEKDGAHFLDLNVDEFSTDTAQRMELMRWLAGIVQQAAKIPLSIDSSSPEILRAGLAACDRGRGQPMLNSVSLERVAAIAVAAEFGACVVASAAGESGLPSGVEDRLANLDRLMGLLAAAGLKPGQIYIDPLVLPISTDSRNGRIFLDAVRAIRARFGKDIHITAGFSNVSFGMPSRKLINQAFTWLSVEAGADSGIVDPGQINGRVLAATDTNAESFKLARALLNGEDEYGAEFIAASREGAI